MSASKVNELINSPSSPAHSLTFLSFDLSLKFKHGPRIIHSFWDAREWIFNKKRNLIKQCFDQFLYILDIHEHRRDRGWGMGGGRGWGLKATSSSHWNYFCQKMIKSFQNGNSKDFLPKTKFFNLEPIF